MYDLKLPPVATSPDCTDAEEFLQVPSTKRQRNGGDGRYTPRSPGPSTPSEETSCCPSPTSILSRFSCSPQPESTATEIEWELHGNSPVSTAHGSIQRFMGQPVVEDEACFGMIRCRCNSTIQHVGNLNSTASHKPYTALVTVTSTTKNAKAPIAVHLLDDATPFGTLDQLFGAVLLPLLNRSMMRIQAVAPLPLIYTQGRQKGGSKATVEIFLNIFGSLEFAAAVGEYLSSNAVYLQHPKYPESGYCYKNPQIFSTCFDGIITETTQTGGIPAPPVEGSIVTSGIPAVLDLFNNLFKSAVLDEMSGGARLKTDLMSHQKQGLYFLHRREQGLSVFDITDTTGKNTCKIRGGILADHMGLGKTLTILALITTTMDLADAFQAGRNSRTCGFILAPRSKATLIVTPVSTLGNWEEQISSHVKPGELSYLVYHGRNRHINPTALNCYDIVITTPSIVAHEWASKHDPLHSIEFYRIVLDEAHDIRTEKTRRSMAICALTAERRWAVTGTPLQNDLSDIATLFKFLKFKPLDTKQGFHNHILADQSGMDNLRSALKAVCLRRTKVVIEANLPSRSVQTHFLDFNDDERKLYNTHKQNLIRSGTRNVEGSAETLRCLSRLRMICDHGKDLLGVDMSSGLASTGRGMTCFVCNQQPPGSTAFEGLGCSHRSICAGCIELPPVLDYKLAECEECSVSEVATQEAAPSPAAEIVSFPYYQGPSSKVAALLQAIRSEFSADFPSPKHVVFSVWTQMLNLVGIALDKAGIPFCRLNGSMQRARRDEELQKFREDPGCVVLLISLMAGGVGINLTCASRVHMMEPYWNPMVELQAIERVHRLGQTQDVVITRYIIRDSIEKYILDLQEKKIKLAKEALDVGKTHIMKCNVKKEILESLDCILSQHSKAVDLC